MKNKSMLLISTNIVFLLTIIAIILVSGTYAKWTSTASGTSATVVAEWSFNVGTTDITQSKTFDFNLFDTANIKDSDGSEETDVAEGVIAPGTSGAFEFVLKNTSDVTAQYEIDFNITNENKIPIEYSTDGINWSKELVDIVEDSDTILAIGSSEKNITVQWRWAFSENDTTDTNLATLENAPMVTIETTITATQINYIYQEHLAQVYELSYYSSLSEAIAEVNNSSIGESVIDNKEGAEACVYTDENNVINVVLLKDIVLSTAIKPTVNMTINLAGKTISCSDTAAFDIMSGNITIDGRMKGSAINTVTTGNKMARAFQARTGNVTVIGGTYTAYSETANSCGIMSAATLTISNATILADGVSGANKGLQINAGSTATISNSNITANSELNSNIGILNNGTLSISDSTILAKVVDGKNSGISNAGTANVSNCNVQAYSNYIAENGKYLASSKGIDNTGTLIITDTYVYGTHSGLQNYGELYINGGIYEGYGHGGFYLVGSDYTTYVKNATIRESSMPDGYTTNVESNNAGAYIGSNSGINAYMDNCDIFGNEFSIVLRGSSSEQNNTLYISNSRINEGGKIRIDNNTHKLYNGVGNNFNSSNTTKPETVIDTDANYSDSFPDF